MNNSFGYWIFLGNCLKPNTVKRFEEEVWLNFYTSILSCTVNNELPG